VVDSLIVDITIQQMIDCAAALGACRPQLALQIIATMFNDKNWEGVDAPEILSFIDGSRQLWLGKKGMSPHEIIGFPSFLKHAKFIPAKLLNEKDMRRVLEQEFLGGLLWGLANEEEFVTWYEAYEKHHTEQLPMYKKADIGVESIQTLAQYLNDCEDIIRDYEAKSGKLSPIPPRLLEDAKKIRNGIEL
jgi:hypothetical protein